MLLYFERLIRTLLLKPWKSTYVITVIFIKYIQYAFASRTTINSSSRPTVLHQVSATSKHFFYCSSTSLATILDLALPILFFLQQSYFLPYLFVEKDDLPLMTRRTHSRTPQNRSPLVVYLGSCLFPSIGYSVWGNEYIYSLPVRIDREKCSYELTLNFQVMFHCLLSLFLHEKKIWLSGCCCWSKSTSIVGVQRIVSVLILSRTNFLLLQVLYDSPCMSY